MDTYEKIEVQIAAKYQAETTTRKAIGDFMLNERHAVNVKSNNIDKKNYSPNMISIRKMHEWVFEKRKDLSFILIDYEVNGNGYEILDESPLIPIEHICWSCLSIEAQGYGVIQKISGLVTDEIRTKCDFYKGFLAAYDKYREKERLKHDNFSRKFIRDPDTIDW